GKRSGSSFSHMRQAFAFLLTGALTTAGCSSVPSTPPHSTTEVKPTESRSSEPKNWTKSETTSKMDGTKQIVLITDTVGQSRASLIIRFKGKTLDVYVNTGEIVDDESASVRIKFDDGAPMKQTWGRS